MKTNEFAKISHIVQTLTSSYQEVRERCGYSDKSWNCRTIDSMARPFLKGYFTLAIVGKVSSGKSTFINALLGCKDLLPTGHNQTTCGITYIEYGESPEITITFGDNSVKTIRDDIKGKVKSCVAIPEMFHNLPVNNIDEMILGGYDFDEIWSCHEDIEANTDCAPIDKSLLQVYVENRKLEDIAVEVHIKYPFNEELKGWRVVDTPGIGAIGGIETRTLNLLDKTNTDGLREIDAIIFLQDGSDTLDESVTKKFVKKQLSNFTKTDRDRLFFVLTHSASTDFINYKDNKLDFVSQNYGDKIKVLTYADSLLYTFLNAAKDLDLKCYDDFPMFEGWQAKEWVNVLGILDQAKRSLRLKGDSVNNGTMLRILNEWSHFDELKNEINQFAKKEKEKTLCGIFKLILSDYSGFIRKLEEDKDTIDGEMTAINSKIDAVNKKRNEYNRIAQEADYLITIDKIKEAISFIDERLHNIGNLPDIDSVRAALTNMFDEVKIKEKNIFFDLKKQFSDILKNFESKELFLEPIDFTAIEYEAMVHSQEKYVISESRVIHKCCESDVIIPARYGNRINYEKKLKEFKVIAIKRARKDRDKVERQIKEKADNLKTLINEEVDNKLKEELSHLENLKTQLSRKEEFKAEKDACMAETSKASKELIKIAEEYGCEL